MSSVETHVRTTPEGVLEVQLSVVDVDDEGNKIVLSNHRTTIAPGEDVQKRIAAINKAQTKEGRPTFDTNAAAGVTTKADQVFTPEKIVEYTAAAKARDDALTPKGKGP